MTIREIPLAVATCNEQGDRAPSTESGFALLEALVALAASAFVLTLYFQILGRTALARQILDDRLTVAAFAQSKFDSVGTVVLPIQGMTEGRFGDIFRWKLDISDDTGAVDSITPCTHGDLLSASIGSAGAPSAIRICGCSS